MNENEMPFVSICTPTFNRRPFVPIIIQCFMHQTYPKSRIEWIIIDDGSDPVGDLFKEIPQVKYFYYPEKMNLGKKRNLMHEKCSGDFIVYMDDDDYYPPERISHAVDMLQKNPQVLCAGSSEMHIYFKHIQRVVQFGPYNSNHSTAATFAFRKELLNHTKYNEESCVAEEKEFLKNYSIPLVQLDTRKTILVFSHIHNSFDKKAMLDNPNKYMKISSKTVDDFIKEPEIKKFFLEDIDELLDKYQEGDPIYKQQVLTQMVSMTAKRNLILREKELGSCKTLIEQLQSKLSNQMILMQDVMRENAGLKDENSKMKEKVTYLEEKIKEVIQSKISILKRGEPL
jgi:glycosyltransferase involved in cell wall biosynthesis